MKSRVNLIEQLEEAVSDGDIGRRAKVLRLVTDLFVLGSGRFTEEHVALFDEVMRCMIAKVEIGARTSLVQTISSLADAPRGVIRELAFDKSIDVAGPVVSHSTRLETADLVEIARTMSQPHLLALTERASLPAEITDILLDRGNDKVARGAARNLGAEFSDGGYSSLLAKSRCDDELAISVWQRPDLPRLSTLRLFVDASESVRKQFEALDPRKSALIQELVAQASNRLFEQARTASVVHVDARSEVEALHRSAELTDDRLIEFAERADFDRTTIALSLICDLPIDLVERIVMSALHEQLFILAKAVGLSWRATKAILGLSAAPGSIADADYERAFASFTRLQPKTAKTALQFYRLREQAVSRPGGRG